MLNKYFVLISLFLTAYSNNEKIKKLKTHKKCY